MADCLRKERDSGGLRDETERGSFELNAKLPAAAAIALVLWYWLGFSNGVAAAAVGFVWPRHPRQQQQQSVCDTHFL